MKKSCKELKRISRENLTGHYSIPMIATAATEIILMAIELPFSTQISEHSSLLQNAILYTAEFLIFLIRAVLTCGLFKLHLNMARKKSHTFVQLFFGFQNHPDRFLLAGLSLALLAFVAGIPLYIGTAIAYFFLSVPTVLLAVILGLISLFAAVYLQLRFHLLYFLLLDHDDMDLFQALKQSAGLMKGNMGRLFYICLSFTGMYLLAVLSFGIGFLWVKPYQMQTLTNFYLDLIGNLPESFSEQYGHAKENYPSFDSYA